MTRLTRQLPIYYSSDEGHAISAHQIQHPKGGRWLVLTGAGDDDLHVLVLGSATQKNRSALPLDGERIAACAAEAVRQFQEVAEEHGARSATAAAKADVGGGGDPELARRLCAAFVSHGLQLAGVDYALKRYVVGSDDEIGAYWLQLAERVAREAVR